ncbi:MAG: DUF4276 family protein [Planctomycetota bacterium]|nr:DUF4276 family protein [Planctomycetota bacterium]
MRIYREWAFGRSAVFREPQKADMRNDTLEEDFSNLGLFLNRLKTRDNWDRPAGAVDKQVLFMTTCMETWIVADRETLRKHYGHKLQETALPPTNDLESRDRAVVQDKLKQATRNCSNAYKKGKRSFLVIGELNPVALVPLLPSFARAKKVLKEKL